MKKNKNYKSVLVLLFTFQFLFLTDMVAQDFAENDFNDSNSTQLAILVVFL